LFLTTKHLVIDKPLGLQKGKGGSGKQTAIVQGNRFFPKKSSAAANHLPAYSDHFQAKCIYTQ
jgi:hypothetical protein